MTTTTIKRNGLKAWFLALRPKTLTGAAAPVLLALALCYKDAQLYSPPIGQSSVFQWVPALLCLLFALLMQVDANFINDYFDCINGVDGEERLGPKRACAQGWISLHAMQRGIAFTTCLSLAVGIPTVLWGGLELLIVGVVCVVFAFLYTTILARKGLGDLLVIVFFGIVPVCVTYYVQLHTIPLYVFLLSIGMGLVTDNLLIVNNYRDRETDITVGKKTLVALIGANTTEWLYLILGILGVASCQILWSEGRMWGAILPVAYLIPHLITWRTMVKINHGKELNAVLGRTALNIFLFALLAAIGVLL